MTEMTIREKGYHRWDGQLQSPAFPWLPMFWNGIKAAFKKRFAKGMLIFCSLPFFVFLIGIYVSTRPELRMLKDIVRLLDDDAKFFNIFLTNNNMTFLLILLGTFLGAELISGDIRFNAFPLYFARPLVRKDYITGKFSILMFYFLLITGVPAILLYIFKVIFTGKLAIGFFTLVGLLAVPVIMSAFISSLVLMTSSITRNTRHAKIFIFMLYFLSMGLAEMLADIFKNSFFFLLSISHLVRQLGTFVFNIRPEFDYPAFLSLVVIAGLTLGAYFLIYRRIEKLEAQIESSN